MADNMSVSVIANETSPLQYGICIKSTLAQNLPDYPDVEIALRAQWCQTMTEASWMFGLSYMPQA